MKLTTWERIVLANTVASQQGDMKVIRQCIKLLDKLEFTDNEKSEIKLTATNGSVSWHEAGKKWEIDFSDEQIAMLKEWLEKQTWAALEARLAVALCAKFGIAE